MKKENISRTRNYATVVYPESAPENWLSILSDSHVPCFVSPLHDLDLNPNGEKKKPHYHVLVMFDSVKTSSQARELFESFGGVGCETVNSCRAYARYLCHLDNPEKAHYSIDGVRQFGGSDYIANIGTMSDKNKAIGEMMDFIDDNYIIAYCQLLSFARLNRSDWFDCLINGGCTFTMKEYIKSKFWLDSLQSNSI